jgi:Serine-pyruvate aminotransferase/archaeal aspartate aminotransferase
VRIPAGLTDSDIIAAARKQFGVVISAGPRRDQGQAAAHRPYGAGRGADLCRGRLTAGGALRQLGRKIDLGRGVDAAMAVVEAGEA